MLPEVGEYVPNMSFSNVDLPEPLSPIRPVSGAESVHEISRRHAVPFGQEKERLLKVDMKAAPLVQ